MSNTNAENEQRETTHTRAKSTRPAAKPKSAHPGAKGTMGKQTGAGKRPASKPARKKKRVASAGSRMKKVSPGLIIMVSLAVVTLAAVIVIGTNSGMASVRGAVGAAFTPVQSALTSTSNWISSKMNLMFNQSELERENAELRRELSSIYVRISRYEDVIAENERLTGLLRASQSYPDYEPVLARVIGKDTGNWFQTFTIDKGVADGIVKDMAVMSADGLVGSVSEAGPNYAKVTSIIDSTSGVGASIERNRTEGVVRGVVDSTDEQLYMYYMQDINNLTPGDVVVTSGLDSIFPKGLPIGTVSQISRQSSGLSQYVVIEPYTDFKHIEEVLVLTTATEQTRAAAAQQLQSLIDSGLIEGPTDVPVITPTPIPAATLEPGASPSPVPSGDWYVGDDEAGLDGAIPTPDVNALGETTAAPDATFDPDNPAAVIPTPPTETQTGGE